MTKHEAVVIETYTGIVMLVGDDRKLIYEYAEHLLGHPIYTHEFPKYADKLKELSKPDFIEICKNLTDSEAVEIEVKLKNSQKSELMKLLESTIDRRVETTKERIERKAYEQFMEAVKQMQK